MVLKGEDILDDKMVEIPVDMVILPVGLDPGAGAPEELASMLGIAATPTAGSASSNYNADPTETERGGIFVAGVCQGPKDIPDTVAQASAVAAGVLREHRQRRGHGQPRRPHA